MSKNTRRDFIKRTALGAAAFMAYPAARVLGANERVRLAIVGVGLRGQELLKQTLTLPNAQVVVVADVYTRRFDEARKILPGLQTVSDYRRVLDMKTLMAAAWLPRCTFTRGIFWTRSPREKTCTPKRP